MGGVGNVHDTLNQDKFQMNPRLKYKIAIENVQEETKGEFSYNLGVEKAFQTITQNPQAIKTIQLQVENHKLDKCVQGEGSILRWNIGNVSFAVINFFFKHSS